MALPTAPLGSMANINLPSHIPTQVVDKRNPLEMALAAFLAGAAQNAGGKLVDNALASDMAAKVGQEKASFGAKLLGGPAVSKEQYAQMTQEEAMMKRLQAQLGAGASEGAADRGLKKELTQAEITARAQAQDKSIAQQREEFADTSRQAGERIRLGYIGADQADKKLDLETKGLTLQEKEVMARLARLEAETGLDPVRRAKLEAETTATMADAFRTDAQTGNIRAEGAFLDSVRNPKKSSALDGAKLPPTKAGNAPQGATSQRTLGLSDIIDGTSQIVAERQDAVQQRAAELGQRDAAKATQEYSQAVARLQELAQVNPELARRLAAQNGIDLNPEFQALGFGF